MIPNNDLEMLQSFKSHGGITLSAYLRLDTPQRRASAHDEFLQQVQVHLDKCDRQPECREAIKEDMEIVKLYLQTNGHRRHAGLAIFSCASELFWRAYPLLVPVPTEITVGPGFNVEPLRQVSCASDSARLPLGSTGTGALHDGSDPSDIPRPDHRNQKPGCG